MILKYDFAGSSAGSQSSSVPLKTRLAPVLDSLNSEFSSLGLDAIVLTSKDPFISEYVPVENNPRYGATGFTGSVGDAIFWPKGSAANGVKRRASLFVDGRYHLQADNECPLDCVAPRRRISSRDGKLLFKQPETERPGRRRRHKNTGRCQRSGRACSCGSLQIVKLWERHLQNLVRQSDM